MVTPRALALLLIGAMGCGTGPNRPTEIAIAPPSPQGRAPKPDALPVTRANLLVIAKSTLDDHVFAIPVDPNGDALSILEEPTKAVALLTVEVGLLARVGVDEIWLAQGYPQPRLTKRIATAVKGDILAASGDAETLLVSEGKAPKIRLVVRRGAATAHELGEFRDLFGTDVSSDGQRLVFGAAKTACTEGWIARCPIDLFAVELTTTPPTVRILVSGGSRAAYQPAFVPRSNDVGYQTTVRDSAFDGNLNACRHDLMRVDFDGRAPARLLREWAVGSYYARDASTTAFLTYGSSEGTCLALPCDAFSLYVGRTADLASARRLAFSDVARFGRRGLSPDGNWVVYAGALLASKPGEKPSEDRVLKVLSSDGVNERTIVHGRVVGWMSSR